MVLQEYICGECEKRSEFEVLREQWGGENGEQKRHFYRELTEDY